MRSVVGREVWKKGERGKEEWGVRRRKKVKSILRNG
jgi:hypothetical protein